MVYVQWMQDAAIRHSDTVGCTEATRHAKATWVARSHRIDYLRPAFAGDSITVRTWVVSARSLRQYQFLRTNGETLLAKGETEWVFVDATTGRPRPIPPEVSGVFELAPETDSQESAG